MRVSPIDAIGDRLDHPENVPEELKHLIADDVARVEKILSIPVSGRVLDVGCSDGAITRRIQQRWPDAIVGGCDIRATTFPYWQWDIRQPAQNVIPCDAIYACEVFEHLTDADAQKALTNILAVLKPGGDLVVTVPNHDCAEEYEAGCRARWQWPDHRSVWRYDKLHALLAPHFAHLEFLPLDPRDHWRTQMGTFYRDASIWLIVHASGKK